MTLLEVEHLTTWFKTDRGPVHAVTDVSLELERGRTLGLVGESGSGKSVLIRSIMGTQAQERLERYEGKVRFEGVDLRTLSSKELRQTWLKHISIVPQNPLTSLNPVLRVGNQIRQVLYYRFGMRKKEANERGAELLQQVGIDDPERRLRSYPHELSGGMRQRIAIAMALAGEPDLLIADEPTTALDVTVQAQIVALLRRLREERNMAMIFVSHDIALVASLADEIAVMYGGRIVEQAPTDLLIGAPLMPYAHALMRAIPQVTQPRRTELASIPGRPPTMLGGMPGCAFHPRCEYATEQCATDQPPLLSSGTDHKYACWHPVLEERVERDVSSAAPHLREGAAAVLNVRDLVVEFPARHGEKVHAVSGISFDILQGETLGLVGESGCGKSTTGHAIVQLVRPTSGSIHLDGVDLSSLDKEALRRMRPNFQMIFQDPIASLNPTRRIRQIVEEPLSIWRPKQKDTWDALVRNAFDEVGLDPDVVGERRPNEFSGGQLQRISIARALVLNPRLIVCDEPVSSLDVSVQAQIINLLRSMQERLQLTLLFIAHDLAVVKNISDRLAVMYLGRLCEIGDADQVYEQPAHHYTRALLASVPKLGIRSEGSVLEGELPSAMRPPHGCRFRTRCPAATQLCVDVDPPMERIGDDHFVACHHPVLEGGSPVTVALRATAVNSRNGPASASR